MAIQHREPPADTSMNRVVTAVLRSRAHWLLSRWVCLVSSRGRRSGRSIRTPAQYATDGTDIIILVGRAGGKTWWRNFAGARGGEVDVLIAGQWRCLHAEAVVGADDPDRTARLLAAFIERFPRAAKMIDGVDDEDRVAHAVLVHCSPRATTDTGSSAIDDAIEGSA